jgi:hypothetical protein
VGTFNSTGAALLTGALEASEVTRGGIGAADHRVRLIPARAPQAGGFRSVRRWPIVVKNSGSKFLREISVRAEAYLPSMARALKKKQ